MKQFVAADRLFDYLNNRGFNLGVDYQASIEVEDNEYERLPYIVNAKLKWNSINTGEAEIVMRDPEEVLKIVVESWIHDPISFVCIPHGNLFVSMNKFVGDSNGRGASYITFEKAFFVTRRTR